MIESSYVPPYPDHQVAVQDAFLLDGPSVQPLSNETSCNVRVEEERQELIEPPDAAQRFGYQAAVPEGLGVVDDFDTVATSYVQAMLSKLVGEHQSRVRSLQSEIRSLREKLGHAESKGRQNSRGVDYSNGDLSATPVAHNSETLECQGVLQATPVHHTMPTTASPERLCATPCQGGLRDTPFQHSLQSMSHTEFDGVTPNNETPAKSTSSSPEKKHGDSKDSMKRVGEVVGGKKGKQQPSRMWIFNSAPDTCFSRFVHGNTFEIGTGAVILANTMMMAMQSQYNGLNMGHTIRPGEYPSSASEAWPGADIAFEVLDFTFNILFSAELIFRLYAYRLQSLQMPWMWFDSIIVGLGLVETITDGGGIGIDPTMMRLVRLVRLVRLLKVFKAMAEFDSLFLLVKSISASINALFWSLLILSFVQVGAALFLCQLLSEELDKLEDQPERAETRDKLFEYFGTFSRAMMTMFEITLANWVPTCRFLMEEINEAFFLFYLVYRCMFCFAVLKVIAAVFISETNRVLASDVELTLMKASREKAEFTRKLLAILQDMDEDGNGTVSLNEVKIFLEDPDTPLLLTTVGFDTDDVEKVFLLTQENGSVNIEKFVGNFLELKGQSKTVDLQDMFKVIRDIDVKLQGLPGYCGPTRRVEVEADEATNILRPQDVELQLRGLPPAHLQLDRQGATNRAEVRAGKAASIFSL